MGGKKIFDTNLDTVSEDILSYAHIDEFRNLTYANQDNNVYTNYVKRTLNYYISYEHCEGFIDKLMKKFFPDEENS